MSQLSHPAHVAIVSRREAGPATDGLYLQLSAEGAPRWTPDPQIATAFNSMREASRVAARLPAVLRAFSVPRQAEILDRRDLH